MESRSCSTCHVRKPLTIEYFAKGKDQRGGLRTQCRECQQEYYREWYRKHKAGEPTDTTRSKDLYTIKEVSSSEKRRRLIQGYSNLYYIVFNKNITRDEVEKIVDDNS